MGDGSQQPRPSKQGGLQKPSRIGARRSRLVERASNILPFVPGPTVRSANTPPLPAGHQAEIIFFTGVQIVRDRRQG